MQAVVEHRIGAEREQDRRRVGKPCRFDHDPAKTPDLAGFAPLQKAAQGHCEIFANSTTKAPAR